MVKGPGSGGAVAAGQGTEATGRPPPHPVLPTQAQVTNHVTGAHISQPYALCPASSSALGTRLPLTARMHWLNESRKCESESEN